MHNESGARKTTFERHVFLLFLFLAIAARLFLVACVPFGQTIRHHLEGLNDEPAHFNYVKYLAVHHSLPVQLGTVKDAGALERNDFEYYQPPLYYIIGAAFHAAFGERTAFYCCRLFSFLCGIITIFLIGAIVYKIVPDPLLRRYALLFAGIFPTHAYFCALISNDALSWLFSTLIVYELVKAGAPQKLRRLPWKNAACLTIYLAAGMLTKSSTAVFFVVLAAWFFMGSLGRRRLPMLLQGCMVLGTAALLSLPWYHRNIVFYHSWFALNMGFGPPVPNLTSLRGIIGFIGKTIHYFWFPMQHGVPGSIGIKIGNVTGGMILLGQVIAAARYVLGNKRPSFGIILLGFVLILAAASYISLNASYSEPEGRFLLPAFAAIVFFFGAPTVGVIRRMGSGSAVLWAAIVVSAYPWLYLLFTKTN